MKNLAIRSSYVFCVYRTRKMLFFGQIHREIGLRMKRAILFLLNFYNIYQNVEINEL